MELTGGALYANDADWQKAYATCTPEEVEKLKTAAFYLQDQAKASGLTFTTPDGKQQAGFTSTNAQFNNSKYLATQAFSDAKTRDLYSSQAAISLQEMGLAGGAKFSLNTAQGFATGVPEGAMDALKSYALLLDTATYAKLAEAVKVMMADPSGTMSKLASSLQGQAQDAAIGIYIDWLQKDSAALGESAGQINGGALVDMALAATGAKVGGIVVDTAEQFSKLLSVKIKTLGAATGTVWDGIKRVDAYGTYLGTILPEAYIATIEGKQLFVAPNATKYLLEDLYKSVPSPSVDVGGKVEPWQRPIAGESFNQLPDPIRTQSLLLSMHEGVADIMRNNKVEFNKVYVSQDGWEIIFAPPKAAGTLPAIKHARQTKGL